MNMEMVLLGIIVFQQLYWGYQTHKLVDKLMSRNYHEYKQAEGQELANRAKPESFDTPDLDLNVMRDYQPL